MSEDQDLAKRIEAAERDMEAAFVRLQRLAAGGATSGDYGRRCGAEARYGAAYAVLVRLGRRPRLRRGYRGGG